jgi:hypothetical protein
MDIAFLSGDYQDFLDALKNRISQAQARAALFANWE